MVHCFACGYNAGIEEFVSNCFGHDDGGQFGRVWLVKNFMTISVEERKPILLNVNREPKKSSVSYIAEDELEKYRYYHPYMYKRRLTDEVIEMFDVGYDNHFELYDKFGKVVGVARCITFPVRDITGQTLFIARRSVDRKFFHYPEGVEKPVYGIYELMKYRPDVSEVLVCESIINALTCWVYGRPAVALNGTGTDYQYRQLKELPQRLLIGAFDPDNAGRRATEKFQKKLAGVKLTKQLIMPEGKDVNDLEEEEFRALQEIF
jgi:DNA primase